MFDHADPLEDQKIYKVTCESGHSKELTATELENLLVNDDCLCPSCGGAADFAWEVELECYICSLVFAVSSCTEAKLTIYDGCLQCSERGFSESSVHVPRSWQAETGELEWARSEKNPESLLRGSRTDYWEGLVHFCEPTEFARIQRDRLLRASPTGYFHVPAVCLTEATLGNWIELQERHGSFGFVFEKKGILSAGGGPAVYLADPVIKGQIAAGGFLTELKPFVNLLRIPTVDPTRTKHDFLHEREWRVPGDLLFTKLQPFAVVLGDFSVNTLGWRHIIAAALEHGELPERS